MRGTVLGNCREATVRTYNYRRGTVTDHGSGKIIPLDRALSGEVQPFIDALVARVEENKCRPS